MAHRSFDATPHAVWSINQMSQMGRICASKIADSQRGFHNVTEGLCVADLEGLEVCTCSKTQPFIVGWVAGISNHQIVQRVGLVINLHDGIEIVDVGAVHDPLHTIRVNAQPAAVRQEFLESWIAPQRLVNLLDEGEKNVSLGFFHWPMRW